MLKKFLSLLIILGILFTLKILTAFMIEEYLTKVFKQKIELDTLSIIPLKLKTKSLGGLAELTYQDEKFRLYFANFPLSSFEKINKPAKRKKMIIEKGEVNGLVTYNPYENIYVSELKASNIIINGIDLDKKLVFFNDVIGFNIVSLFRNFLNNIETSNKQTRISHFQFSTTTKDTLMSLDDVSFSTRSFRIVLLGKVYIEGQIENFEAHLIDKNGCSIISQELTGNIKDPHIKKAAALEKIIKTVPTSMFGTGMKIANFTKDKFNAAVPKSKYNISRQLFSTTNVMFHKTSKIVMPKECKRIYTGEVQHPIAYKKGFI